MAADSVKRDVREVVRLLGEDPKLATSLLSALRSAQYTDSSEKLKVLGESLAALLDDSAQVDSEEWFIRQVAVVENYHMRVLSCWILTDEKWASLRHRNGGLFGNRQWLGWSRSELEEASGLQFAGELADELTRHGFLLCVNPDDVALIDTGYDYSEEPTAVWPVGGGHDCWMLDDLGIRLIERIGVAELWAGGAFRRGHT